MTCSLVTKVLKARSFYAVGLKYDFNMNPNCIADVQSFPFWAICIELIDVNDILAEISFYLTDYHL